MGLFVAFAWRILRCERHRRQPGSAGRFQVLILIRCPVFPRMERTPANSRER
jgi:hypothetical protein